MKSWGQLFYRLNNNPQSFICYLRISKREVQYSKQIIDSNLYYTIVYLWAINNYEILKIHSSHKRINAIITIKHLGDPGGQALVDMVILHRRERMLICLLIPGLILHKTLSQSSHEQKCRNTIHLGRQQPFIRQGLPFLHYRETEDQRSEVIHHQIQILNLCLGDFKVHAVIWVSVMAR